VHFPVILHHLNLVQAQYSLFIISPYSVTMLVLYIQEMALIRGEFDGGCL